MLRDANLNFDTNLAVTVTATSTNTIDLGVARDMGNTDNLLVSTLVGTSFAGGTSLQVTVQGSPDNATWTTLASGEAVPVASLLQGAQIANLSGLPSVDPVDGAPMRYLRLQYVVVGTMTAGALTSDIVMNRDNARGYPKSYSVSAPTLSVFTTS